MGRKGYERVSVAFSFERVSRDWHGLLDEVGGETGKQCVELQAS